MADMRLRSLRFRTEREGAWRRLEQLLDRVERRSGASLSDDEMIAIPGLYRAALSSLSVARATSLDQALIDYLEALSARAYFFVYGARTPLLERIARFFIEDWPAAVRSLWRETVVSLLLMTAGAVAAFLLTWSEPDWFFAFVPESLAGGRDPHASGEFLRQTLYAVDEDKRSGLGVMSTLLFTHNAQIAIFSFALGFAFCLPSAMLIAYNGCMLGAFFALYASHGLTYEFGGWVFVHGVTELFAVALAGAAGFGIGWSIAFPGAQTRLAAAERAGRRGGVAMIGCVVMLSVAGLLEGFARQLVTLDAARWAIALATALFWGVYFYAPRRRPRHG
jgi:uncharacterized membrane protein SpoIIM required for sporulation